MTTYTKDLLIKGIEYIKKPTGLLSDNYKQKYNKVLELLAISGIDTDRKRIASLTDPKEQLLAARKLVRHYPDHPLSHLELLQCLYHMNDPCIFEHMERYSQVRSKWLESTGYGELGLEFIWPGAVVGSLGNHFEIMNLLKANKCGLRPAIKPCLLLPKNAQLRNPALFEYFEQYLHVIQDIEVIRSLRKLESLLTLPGFFLPFHNSAHFLDIAANLIEIEREKQGLEPDFFQLNERHREMGAKALRRLGLPERAWYVTLHVREPGYRGETRENTTENWRNANPLDYLKACEAVTRAGGWVFRMGDPTMISLPPTSQVIDYAHHEIRCDWMDVFLGATSRFCIGTSSGYYSIPMFFGIPVLATNFLYYCPYFGLTKQDLYLPRLLVNIKTKQTLSIEDCMSPPTSMYFLDNHYLDAGLHWVGNTPEELEAATKEMIERTDGNLPSTITDEEPQRHFKAMADACGLKYGSHPAKALAPISQDFLERHANLL